MALIQQISNKTPTSHCHAEKCQMWNSICMYVVWCSSSPRGLLHTISHLETLLCWKVHFFLQCFPRKYFLYKKTW
jgi:hypothetical protein